MASLTFDAAAAAMILEYVKDGLFATECCEAAGVSKTRYKHWVKQARKGLEYEAHEDIDHPLHDVAVWWVRISKEELKLKRMALNALMDRAKKGDTAAIKFFMTHRGRDDWHQREAKGGATTVKVMPYVPGKTKVE